MVSNVSTPDIQVFAQSVFTVQLLPNVDGADSNGDLSSYAQIIGRSCMTDQGNGASLTNILPDPIIAQILDPNNSAVPTYFFSKGVARDTSLGGNDAINCYPQFNETDDVAEHPFLSTNPADPQTGMGRVYTETYNDQQQIMYLTFGVPQYNSLVSFYTTAMMGELASIMTTGGNVTGSNLGTLIGHSIGLYVTLPVVPLIFLYNLFSGLSEVPITKYYDFRSAMPLYYRCVNSMLLHLSVNMGLVQDNLFLLGKNPPTASQIIIDQTDQEAEAEVLNKNLGGSTAGLPEVFRKYGFDVYRILLKKYKYITEGLQDPGTEDNNYTDFTLVKNDLRQDPSTATTPPSSNTVGSKIKTFFSDTITGFASQLYDANLYIGFRIEKGVDTSESFSNETGESSIAQEINGKIQSIRDAKFSFAGGNITGAIGDAISALSGVVSGAMDAVGLGGLDAVMTGEGLVDFPEVWKNSSFSKSYSFSMHLRSPYGDPVSILQNLYFPLALILAGGMPRAVGQSSYTAPFVCRAYCKGMFAIPLGMITSMHIKRGSDQFGWNLAKLPTCIDISFEIKDLSPAMYLSFADRGSTFDAFTQIFSANTNYQEYLMTLSGMGLAERITWFYQLRNKANYLLGQIAEQKLNGFYWGSVLGNTIPARAISVFMPATKLPQN